MAAPRHQAPQRHSSHAPVGRLHVLTDVRGDPRTVVGAALEAGAPVIQVRAVGLTDRALFDLAAAVVAACRRNRAQCIVNDRVDIALAAGADGVHLGADDLPVEVVRALAGNRLVIGATARTPSAARRLAAAGADYLGIGPVYPTTTKEGLPDPIGVDGLAAVTAATDLPVIAISGITADRIGAVIAAGAYGVAVVGAVSRASEPSAATRALLDALASSTSAGTNP